MVNDDYIIAHRIFSFNLKNFSDLPPVFSEHLIISGFVSNRRENVYLDVVKYPLVQNNHCFKQGGIYGARRRSLIQCS